MPEDLGDLDRAIEEFQRALIPWAKTVASVSGALIGAGAISTFHRSPGPPRPSRLTIRSGRLVRSLAQSRGIANAVGSTGTEGFAIVKVSGYLVELIKGTRVPYAAVHEYGIDREVAVRKHERTSRLGHTYTVQAHKRHMVMARRAYLAPGVQKALPKIEKLAAEELAKVITRVFNAKSG